MPSLKYKSHNYTKTVRTSATYEGGSPAAQAYTERTEEELRVVFEIVGAEEYDRNRRGTQPKLTMPEAIVARYHSINGEPWSLGHSAKLQAFNVKKGGVRGADVDLETWDWPDGAEDLIGKSHGKNTSEAMAWVVDEYPREVA